MVRSEMFLIKAKSGIVFCDLYLMEKLIKTESFLFVLLCLVFSRNVGIHK